MAYYSDYVQDVHGEVRSGLTVKLYKASAFSEPPTGNPGAVTPVATTTTDSYGKFTFSNVADDQYHIVAIDGSSYIWKHYANFAGAEGQVYIGPTAPSQTFPGRLWLDNS